MRLGILLAVFLLGFLIFFPLQGGAETLDGNVEVKMEEDEIKIPLEEAYLDKETGRTYIPVKAVADLLEADISWNSEDNEVIMEKDNDKIRMPAGGYQVFVNDKEVYLDAASKIVKGKVIVPMRLVETLTEAQIKWNENDEMISINTENGAVEISRQSIEKAADRQTNVLSRSGERFRYDQKVQMEATAYTHTGNPTATGVWPSRGTVAVDPSLIPFGTELYVEDYGFAKARDKGSAIKGKRIDLFMESRAKASRWGRRTVNVYVVDNIDPIE